MIKRLSFLFIILSFVFAGCSKDDDMPSVMTQEDLQGKWMEQYYDNIYSFDFEGNKVRHVISNTKKMTTIRDLRGTFTIDGSTLHITVTEKTDVYDVGAVKDYGIRWANSDKTKIDVEGIGELSKTKY